MLSQLVIFSCSFSLSLGFKFYDCGSKDAIVRFEDVSFKPEPLSFGGNAFVAATMKMREKVVGGYDKFEMHRIVKLLGYPIALKVPCVMDRCERRDLCDDLGPGTMLCKWFAHNNRTCGCPDGPDTIKSNNFQLQIPQFNSLMSFLLNGLYRIKWTWQDYRGKEIACALIEVAFASPKRM